MATSLKKLILMGLFTIICILVVSTKLGSIIYTTPGLIFKHSLSGYLFTRYKLPFREEKMDFQKIGNDPSVKSYAYSAFFSKNGITGNEGPSVIVVAALKEKRPPNLVCKFYTESYQFELEVPGMLQPVEYENDHWKFIYQPFYILCAAQFLPAFVSVVEVKSKNKSQEEQTNLLRVQYKGDQKKYDFSMCVAPLRTYEDPLRFTEWMEYHIMMGVQKFRFYNTSLGPKTSCLLETYGDIIEILPFSNPYEFHKEIVVGGQDISAHDCLQRFRGVSKYLMIVDMDEMIVPLDGSKNFMQMMAQLQNYYLRRKPSNKICGYRFSNKYFFGEKLLGENWTSSLKIEGNPKAEKILRKMQMSTKVLRETGYDNLEQLTKFIIIPDMVFELSFHQVTKSAWGTSQVNVPSNLAYLHHYRSCHQTPWFQLNCSTLAKTFDNSSMQFATDVAIRVSERLFQKDEHCNVYDENLNFAN